jgi:hypothetical protein
VPTGLTSDYETTIAGLASGYIKDAPYMVGLMCALPVTIMHEPRVIYRMHAGFDPSLNDLLCCFLGLTFNPAKLQGRQ